MSFLDKVRAGLERTKKSFVKNMETLVIGYDEIDEEFLDDLEAVMLTGDLGVTATDYLLGEIRTAVKEGEIHSTKEVIPFLAKTMETWLAVDNDPAALPHSPEVILIVGVNGVGKTTSIGKLAQYYKNAGKKVLLAAGDTFRAAASEQLTIWADRYRRTFAHQSEFNGGTRQNQSCRCQVGAGCAAPNLVGARCYHRTKRSESGESIWSVRTAHGRCTHQTGRYRERRRCDFRQGRTRRACEMGRTR